MNSPRFLMTVSVVLLSCAAQPPVRAQLPTNEPPWLGDFAVFANRHYQLRISTQGKITLTPQRENRKSSGRSLALPVSIIVEESLPNGRTRLKKILPQTLLSGDKPSTQLEKTVIRGQASGGVAFEVCIEQVHGVLTFGGGLLEQGPPRKNPLRFSLCVQFPSAYPREKKADKQAAKAFQKKIDDDRIDLIWTDGKRKKQAFGQALDAAAPALNGPGIASAYVEINAYDGTRFRFTASPNSAMTLSNERNQPLHQGFALHWTPEATLDPEHKARLGLEVR
jgi:hypothetical protein